MCTSVKAFPDSMEILFQCLIIIYNISDFFSLNLCINRSVIETSKLREIRKKLVPIPETEAKFPEYVKLLFDPFFFKSCCPCLQWGFPVHVSYCIQLRRTVTVSKRL